MLLAEDQIHKLESFFKSRPVLKAYLFGSFARGEADSFSDVDILVDLDHSQTIGLRFIQMRLDLEALLGTKVDLVSTGGVSEHIKPSIEREKRLIYHFLQCH